MNTRDENFINTMADLGVELACISAIRDSSVYEDAVSLAEAIDSMTERYDALSNVVRGVRLNVNIRGGNLYQSQSNEFYEAMCDIFNHIGYEAQQKEISGIGAVIMDSPLLREAVDKIENEAAGGFLADSFKDGIDPSAVRNYARFLGNEMYSIAYDRANVRGNELGIDLDYREGEEWIENEADRIIEEEVIDMSGYFPEDISLVPAAHFLFGDPSCAAECVYGIEDMRVSEMELNVSDDLLAYNIGQDFSPPDDEVFGAAVLFSNGLVYYAETETTDEKSDVQFNNALASLREGFDDIATACCKNAEELKGEIIAVTPVLQSQILILDDDDKRVSDGSELNALPYAITAPGFEMTPELASHIINCVADRDCVTPNSARFLNNNGLSVDDVVKVRPCAAYALNDYTAAD